MTDLVHDFCVAEGIPAVSDLAAMIEAYRAGASWFQLCEKFHHGAVVVKRKLEAAGVYVPGEPTPYEENKAEQRADALRLATDQDMTYAEIGAAVGVSDTTVSVWCSQEGIARRAVAKHLVQAKGRSCYCPIKEMESIRIPNSGTIYPTCFCAQCCEHVACYDMDEAERKAVLVEYHAWLDKATARREATIAEARRVQAARSAQWQAMHAALADW